MFYSTYSNVKNLAFRYDDSFSYVNLHCVIREVYRSYVLEIYVGLCSFFKHFLVFRGATGLRILVSVEQQS